MNRYPIKIGFYTKKVGKAHVLFPCADLIKNEMCIRDRVITATADGANAITSVERYLYETH